MLCFKHGSKDRDFGDVLLEEVEKNEPTTQNRQQPT